MTNLILSNYKILIRIHKKWKNYILMHRIQMRLVLFLNQKIQLKKYEFEDKNNLNFKNNIYLATISRVEPSLQAALLISDENVRLFSF